MKPLIRLSLAALAWSAASACSGAAAPAALLDPPAPAPDPDAAALAEMAGQAAQIARQETVNAVLRQVFTDLTRTTFHFTDGAATEATEVTVPAPDAPPDRWAVQAGVPSRMVGYAAPGLTLAVLIVGPDRVAQAMTAQWPGCTVRGLTLTGEGDDLTWIAFCNTPDGVVSGSMDNRTGVFVPSDAPPAPPPVTAMPAP